MNKLADVFLTLRMESDAIDWQGVQVRSVKGRERISEPFSFDIVLVVDTSCGVNVHALMDAPATLIFERGEEEVRRFHGLVAEVRDRFDIESGFRTYTVRLCPRVWRLALSRTMEIYMDKALPDILREVLGRSGFVEVSGDGGEGDFEFRLAQKYEPKEFIVQFDQSDLDFLRYRTEFNGISFFFEHRAGRDVLVFTDSNLGFSESALDADEARFNQGGHRSGVFDLEISTHSIPARYTVRDYNYRNPSLYLQAYYETTAGRGGEVVEYGPHVKTPEEGLALAQIRAEEQMCRHRVIYGQSDIQKLSAGQIVTVTDLPGSDVSLLIHEITHSATQPTYGRGEGTERMYENSFEGYFSDAPYRPERLTPKALVPGMLNGQIAGDSAEDEEGSSEAGGEGEEDDRPYAKVDDQGRYRVQFLFDTKDEEGRLASRAIRMAQPHAGAGYGFHFPLRVGTEVLIGFVNGDPDRPFIASTIPNPQTPSPVAAGNHKRNVIRTGGANEINIDDESGSERIKLTTPTMATTLQIGAPNAPEMGAALTTAGASSTLATTGIGTISTMGATLNAFLEHGESNVITSVAKTPDKATVAMLAAQVGKMTAVVLGALTAVWAVTKSSMQMHKRAVEHDSEEAAREEAEAQSKMERALQDIWAYWDGTILADGKIDTQSKLYQDMGTDPGDSDGIWADHYNLMKVRGWRGGSVAKEEEAQNLGLSGTEDLYRTKQQEQQESIDGLERDFAETYLSGIDALLSELTDGPLTTSTFGAQAFDPENDTRTDGTALAGGTEYQLNAAPDPATAAFSKDTANRHGLDNSYLGFTFNSDPAADSAGGPHTPQSPIAPDVLGTDREALYQQLLTLRELIFDYLEKQEKYNNKATEAENKARELAEVNHAYSTKGEGGQATSIIDLSLTGLSTVLGVVLSLYSGYYIIKSWMMKKKEQTKADRQMRNFRQWYDHISPRKIANPVSPVSAFPFSGETATAYRFPTMAAIAGKGGGKAGAAWADPQHVVGCDGGSTAIYGDKQLYGWGEEVLIHGRTAPFVPDPEDPMPEPPPKGSVHILAEDHIEVLAEKITEIASKKETYITGEALIAQGDKWLQLCTGLPRASKPPAKTLPPKPSKEGMSFIAKKANMEMKAEEGEIIQTAAKKVCIQIDGGPSITMSSNEVRIEMDKTNYINMKPAGIEMNCAKFTLTSKGQVAINGTGPVALDSKATVNIKGAAVNIN